MGFGILFFAYFLILNITYYSYTDLICALLMAIALNKLSFVNKYFKMGTYCSLIFALTGLLELLEETFRLFSPNLSLPFASILPTLRVEIIAVVTLFILLGIENVAKEVGLIELGTKSRIAAFVSLSVYALSAMLEIPGLDSILPLKAVVILGVLSLIAVFALTLINLSIIYKAYVKICMPEDRDNDIKGDKRGFFDKYEENLKQKEMEYREYKTKKSASRKSKKD